jgi:hypothetical protein
VWIKLSLFLKFFERWHMGHARRARLFSQVKRSPFRYAGRAVCGAAVRKVDAAFLGLPSDEKQPAYEIVRRQVHVQLALREELAR